MNVTVNLADSERIFFLKSIYAGVVIAQPLVITNRTCAVLALLNQLFYVPTRKPRLPR